MLSFTMSCNKCGKEFDGPIFFAETLVHGQIISSGADCVETKIVKVSRAPYSGMNENLYCSWYCAEASQEEHHADLVARSPVNPFTKVTRQC